ncbi:hypothetical protein P3T76_007924 [Phytophthora citrophthora]|uniref:RxLR effector protein n=1 Tax=Phytophthora citrophthora TaxID=4793 RepID=A0AAD9GL36_9STRA|nr:hypothetical protein P3T76_007923 [Phytophthora citrophthora]KAK1940473.1 hypothetical protein P3T76_007924 [Phytophthora citrophthora]
MRLSFIFFLAATVSSLVAISHALPQEQSTVPKVSVTNPDQSQTSEKRFLRSAGLGRQMINNAAFKEAKFKELHGNKVSSFTFFVDMLKGKEKYRGLYNDYAAFRNKKKTYP